MALTESLAPATDMLGGGLGNILTYAKWLLPIVIIFGVIGFIWLMHKIRDKKLQWTHTLKIRRVLQNNLLSEPIIHKMRRFPLVKRAEVFELEKAVLGSYLFPEIDEYSGINQYSIILDKNNRIYTNNGEFFNPENSCVNVSAKHAEIDLAHSDLKADYQNINKINKRIEWGEIAKYAFLMIFIISVTVIAIVGISKWGEAQQYKAQEAQSMAEAMEKLSEALITVQATVNTQQLLIPELKELKGTNNLQTLIKNNQENDDI